MTRALRVNLATDKATRARRLWHSPADAHSARSLQTAINALKESPLNDHTSRQVRPWMLIVLMLWTPLLFADRVCTTPDNKVCMTCTQAVRSAIRAHANGIASERWKQNALKGACVFELEDKAGCQKVYTSVLEALKDADLELPPAGNTNVQDNLAVVDARTAQVCGLMNCCTRAP